MELCECSTVLATVELKLSVASTLAGDCSVVLTSVKLTVASSLKCVEVSGECSTMTFGEVCDKSVPVSVANVVNLFVVVVNKPAVVNSSTDTVVEAAGVGCCVAE